MDKQNFQEQDFMEILVRLPCSPRRQDISTAETTICHRGDNNFSQVRNRFFEPQKTENRLTGFRQSPQPICLGNLLLKREVVKLVLYTF